MNGARICRCRPRARTIAAAPRESTSSDQFFLSTHAKISILNPIEHRDQPSGHDIDIRHAIDLMQFPACTVMRQNRCGLRMVCSKPRTNGFTIIIRPSNKLRAATPIANTWVRRLLKLVVITFTTNLTRIAPGDTVSQRSIIDNELNDDVQFSIETREHGVERLGLGNRPRKSVEYKPRRTIRPIDASSQHTNEDIIGNQRAGRHNRLCLKANLTPRSHLCPQHIASRYLYHPVAILQPLRLGALTCTRRTEQDNIHRPRPFTRAFLISPSY